MRVQVTEEPLALAAAELAEHRDGLVSFATGKTFATFFASLPNRRLCATHLDEFVGAPAMADEVLAACPWLRDGFIPVPSRPELIAAHEERLEREGGVALQFLGLGRNGHLAFNEPGTPLESRFHVAELASSTRAELAARFAPNAVPTHAVTAGLSSILSARRIVLVATGAAKAAAVEAMLRRDPASPASCLHAHDDVLVLLDTAAARK